MSGNNTVRMISAYNQMAAPTLFLAGFFQSPAINFHTSEEVEIDIVRSDEDIAIVVQDLSTGHRMNSTDLFTNKKFKPPIFKEAVPINSFDLIKREPGKNPFEAPNFRANVVARMFQGMTKIESKIRRSLELQASQILQTGVVTLSDETGTALYTLDYSPKTSHFPTAAISWDAAGATIVADISALCEVNRDDGLSDSDQVLMGIDAFEAAMANTDFLNRFDQRRVDLGTISPMQPRGQGGMFRGTIDIGNYKLDVWTYGGRYKDPQTGNKISFLNPNKVIVRDSMARMDATFGAIPNIGELLGINAASRLIPELPSRISNVGNGMDLSTTAWISPDGEQLFGAAGSRPLLIPTAIDTYSCLTAVF